MAIEFCSEKSSVVMSPRISFSHDLSQMDSVPVEQYIRSSSPSSIDFDFCVFRESFDQESSSADELFFDGKILPIEIKKRLQPTSKKVEPPLTPPPPPPPSRQPSLHESDNAFSASKSVKMNENTGEAKRVASESDEKQNSKSFWSFKRSTSLNCGSGYARSLCPLPLLSRSNSTGSASSAKRSSFSKENLTHKQHSQKFSSVASMKQSQSSSATGHHQKPPLKKNIYGSHGNGVKINPVLNVPTASLFGLGSIFSSAKEKNRKK